MRCRILSLMASIAVISSCSVKEDRSECACLLVLDMSPCTNAPDNIRIDLKTLDERIEQNFIPGQDKPFYEYPVTKGECALTAFLCPRELSYGTDRILIDPGENCPELYASRSVFEVSGETAEHKVVLHKQFASVILNIEDSGLSRQDCDITVIGGINRISLVDFKPLERQLRHNVPVSAQEKLTFRLPRQNERCSGILVLEISRQGGSPRVFELGKYLSEAGYDWGKEDLEDIVVDIKESEIVIEISSSDWIIQSAEIVEI